MCDIALHLDLPFVREMYSLIVHVHPIIKRHFLELWYCLCTHTHTHTHTPHTHHAQIHKLPRELCRMRHLLSFQFDSSVLTDPPPLTAKWGSHALLHYFSLKQKDAVPWRSFRVVVVGPKSGGKTTLLTKLRGEAVVSTAPTKGLEVSLTIMCSNWISKLASVYIYFIILDCKPKLHPSE